MPSNRINPLAKRSPAYLAGRRAYYNGDPPECPLPRVTVRQRNERYRWYSGYFETQINSRIGHILRKAR